MSGADYLTATRILVWIISPIDGVDIPDTESAGKLRSDFLRLYDGKATFLIPIYSAYNGLRLLEKVLTHQRADAIDFAPEASRIIWIAGKAEESKIIRFLRRVWVRTVHGTLDAALGRFVVWMDLDFLKK